MCVNIVKINTTKMSFQFALKFDQAFFPLIRYFTIETIAKCLFVWLFWSKIAQRVGLFWTTCTVCSEKIAPALAHPNEMPTLTTLPLPSRVYSRLK